MVYMVEDVGLCGTTITMPSSRWGHSSSFIKSKLILCGGTYGDSCTVAPSSTCDLYCVEREKWEKGASMAIARHKAAGLPLLGQMYMIGGDTGSGPTATMEVYDPSKDRWTFGPPLPVAVSAPCAVAYKDSVIVSGGTSGSGERTEVFLFNVTTQQWAAMEPMRQARAGHGCSLASR